MNHYAAELLKRNWITYEMSYDYLRASIFRFIENNNVEKAKMLFESLDKIDADYYFGKNKLNNICKEKIKRKGIIKYKQKSHSVKEKVSTVALLPFD